MDRKLGSNQNSLAQGCLCGAFKTIKFKATHPSLLKTLGS
jgi:hypothetical protein